MNLSSRGTSYTFAQIAEFARTVEPSQTPGTINYCGMIAELAEALDRFEHNVAAALVTTDGNPYLAENRAQLAQWLDRLRQEIPETRT